MVLLGVGAGAHCSRGLVAGGGVGLGRVVVQRNQRGQFPEW